MSSFDQRLDKEPKADPTLVPALLVVDMQYDFVYGTLAVPDGASIIPTINALLALPFAAKIATQDWHPLTHVSFARNHPGKAEFTTTTVYHPSDATCARPHTQELWPVHCVADTPGAALVDGLDVTPLTGTVKKAREEHADAYSAFGDCWGDGGAELKGMLDSVTDVFLVGLAGDYCVKATAVDAVREGYRTWVVRDAVKSVFPGGKEWAEMEEKGVTLVGSEQVKRSLGERK